MSSPRHLEIIPLGGLGEFGMNCMLYRYGDDCLVVDTGMMFPGSEHLGVNVVIPDLQYLERCGTLHGVILTHGHEDHIGSLPFVLAEHEVPAYATPYTLGLIRRRLDEHMLPAHHLLNPLPGDTPLRLGPFVVETLPVAHSIPQAVMVVLRTPAGVVVHTADFKLDPLPPDGVVTDLDRLARLGDEGVLALLSDSTNAEVAGFTPGEQSLVPSLEGLIRDAPGRVFVTTFASNIHRLRLVAELARRAGRRVSLVGSSMRAHAEVAERLGLLHWPAGTRIEAEHAMNLPRDEVLFLVTGSQGEPLSALARIAVDRHRDVYIEAEDRVIHSARIIPGNETGINRMINHLLRRGAEVVTSQQAPVHVSGHPAQEELRTVLRLLRPRYLVPIHGEYRQLLAHRRLAEASGFDPRRILVAESGQVVAVNEHEAVFAGEVPAGQVFLDGTLDEVDLELLRDRRRMAGDGVVVPVVAMGHTGSTDGTPVEVITRGLVGEENEETLAGELRALASRVVTEASSEERADEGLLKSRLQEELRRFFKRRSSRRPLIVPVILEL